MGDYAIQSGLEKVANAINSLASAHNKQADVLAKIAEQYKRQVDLQEYGT